MMPGWRRILMNCNWFQIAMLAYNLNCLLQLFNHEEGAEIGSMRHTTLATARLRFLFVAAKIWRHAGRAGVSYSHGCCVGMRPTRKPSGGYWPAASHSCW